MSSLNGEPEELMHSIDRGFPVSEFEDRLSKTQMNMADAGVELLLFTTEPEFRYYSGYRSQFWQSPTRPWFLLVPAAGKPIAVVPTIGAVAIGKTWLDDIRTWSSPHRDDDGISLLSEAIREFTKPDAKIGMMMGRETNLRMPLKDFFQLQTLLEGRRFEDVTAMVQLQKTIKSELEIDKIRQSAQIASRAFSLVPQILQCGMDEITAFSIFKQACMMEGADDVAFLVGGAGAGGYEDIISPPSQRKLSYGDCLILDVGCLWDGYHCDFDRNFSVGEPSNSLQKAYSIAWGATQMGLEFAKPGITCGDLFSVMNAYMKPHAIASSGGDVGRLGHGLGMQLTEFPSLTSWDETTLAPGMVLTLEPGYEFAPGKMMVHEENIVIREDGAEVLTQRTSETVPVIQ